MAGGGIEFVAPPALKASSVTFQGNRQLSNCEATEVANRIATTVRVLVADNKPCP
ncbi:MAG: hypothetical protein ACOZQL_34780 [Myxococcota bacterium]